MKAETYKGYLLGLLVFITAFNYVERLVLGLLAQSIKHDLSLTDSELGLLSGIAFALFYSTMGIPIARWVDRGNRVTILAVTTALWSVTVALCGAARSFVQLALIRVFVGVGEAGCLPTTNSLIPDYFSRAERPRAMGISALSGPLSQVIGFGVAGWLNQLYGWRATFVIVGLPGLVLALLATLTLREPRKFAASAAGLQGQGESSQALNWKQTCMALWDNVTFRHLAMAYVVIFFFNFGVFQWLPVFFIRSYGLQTGELGTWLALIVGVGGFAGNYLGGEWASRFAGDDEPLQLKATAAVVCGVTVLSLGIYLAHNQYVAFGVLGVYVLLGSTISGPLLAVKQTIVPERMRGISFAILLLFANLIGMGFGPLAGGVLSDLLHPLFGEESLRYALVALTPGYFWAVWHIWRASKTVLDDARRAELSQDDQGPERDVALGTPAH